MNFNKNDMNQLKPWFIVVTYAILLIALMFVFPSLLSWFFKFIMLFTPLFYGIGIAFVLNIPMSLIEGLFERHLANKNGFFYKKIRGISIFITLILTAMIFFIFVTIITPQLVSSAQLLFNNAGRYIVSIVDNINAMLAYFKFESFEISLNQATINNFVQSQGLTWEQIFQNAGLWAIGTGSDIVNNALAFTSGLMTWFTGFMLSLYLLSSKETFLYQARKIILAIFGYKNSMTIFEWGAKANYIFNRFVSGQLLEACILGTIYFVVLTLLNFPFAMLISCIIAVTSIVPMFGAMFGMAVGCLLILAVKPFGDTILFIIVFQLVQTFEGNVIYPRVVGKSVGLPGPWVLLSLIILGALWGLLGMLIAVPFTALMYRLTCEIVNYILKIRKIKVTENSVSKK